MAKRTWEEKLQACQALCDCSLRMRKPGDWYVAQPGIGITDGQFVRGEYGDGATPQAAVESHWQVLMATLADEGRRLFTSEGGKRRYVKWNGHMWAEEAPDG